MENSLCLDEKAKQKTNLFNHNNLKETNNEYTALTISDINQKIFNNVSSTKYFENYNLNNNENLSNNITIKSEYNNSTKNNIQKNKLEIMNVFEYQYINNHFYEKLKNEIKKLIETMRNMEEQYQKEIKDLKEEKKELWQKIELNLDQHQEELIHFL